MTRKAKLKLLFVKNGPTTASFFVCFRSFPSRPLLIYFRPFLITISIIQIEKSVNGVLGI